MTFSLCASMTLLFREVALTARFGRAKRAGIRAIELQSLEDETLDALEAAISAAGLDVVLINVPLGDFMAGGAGLSGVPGREEDFRQAVVNTLEAARRLRARFVNLGGSRLPNGLEPATALETYRRNLSLAVDLCRAAGVLALVEPLNSVDMGNVLIGSTAGAAAVIADHGPDRLGLQFDIYHTHMNGEPVADTFRTYRPLIRHIQFSDAPGRGEPGTGDIDFPMIVDVIDRSGYDGWLGAEYHPTCQTEQTLHWLAWKP
ncbi:MAG: TIM barrel protein [Sphingomonadales bacterium]